MKIEKTSSEKLNAIQKQKKINYKKFKKIICSVDKCIYKLYT